MLKATALPILALLQGILKGTKRGKERCSQEDKMKLKTSETEGSLLPFRAKSS